MKTDFENSELGSRGFRLLLFTSATVSLLFSWWLSRSSVINNDGLYYLNDIYVLAGGGVSATMQTDIGWPFFSWLASRIVLLDVASLEGSVFILNAVLATLVVLGFILVARQLTNNRIVLYAAALVILAFPGVNALRDEIVRDLGYAGFFMLSLWLLLRFLNDRSVLSAVLFSVSIQIATLFRVEGLLFLLALPVVAFALPSSSFIDKTRAFILLYVGLVPGVLVAVALIATSPNVAARFWPLLDRALEYVSLRSHVDVWAYIHSKVAILEQSYLNRYMSEIGMHIALLSILLMVLFPLVKMLTPLFAVLAAYGTRFIDFSQQNAFKFVFVWLSVLHFVLLGGFVVKMDFMMERYTLTFALSLMIAIPFALERLYRNWKIRSPENKLLHFSFPLVAMLVFATLVDGLTSFGPSRDYLKQAGFWLAPHMTTEATLMTNEQAIVYYSGVFPLSHSRFSIVYGWEGVKQALESREAMDYDYFAFRVSRKNAEASTFFESASLVPVKTFVNNRGDKVFVFKGKGASTND